MKLKSFSKYRGQWNPNYSNPFVCLNNESSEALYTSQTSWVFCIRFFSKTKCKTAKKNAAQCISCNLKATSKNSGTFENTQQEVDFPLSIHVVFDQALQLLFKPKVVPPGFASVRFLTQIFGTPDYRLFF